MPTIDWGKNSWGQECPEAGDSRVQTFRDAVDALDRVSQISRTVAADVERSERSGYLSAISSAFLQDMLEVEACADALFSYLDDQQRARRGTEAREAFWKICFMRLALGKADVGEIVSMISGKSPIPRIEEGTATAELRELLELWQDFSSPVKDDRARGIWLR